jgi:hypothetical protein
MPKILYIDTWDKGYRNFTRLNNEFLQKGFETIFIHTSSFAEKVSCKEKKIHGLTTRDISYYNTIFIKKIIEVERPDVIMILNLSFVFDRAIVNNAKNKNIKVVFLAHGKLTNPNVVELARDKLNKEIWFKISRIFKKKNFYILLNYIDSQVKKNKLLIFFKILIAILRSPSNYLVFPEFNQELDADLIFVYTKEDKELYENKFFFPSEKIKVVGNPEISFFYNSPLESREIFLNKLSISSREKYILYLDDGLAENNVWSVSNWYSHLEEIDSIINKEGFRLIVKMHPRVKKDNHKNFFNEKNIICLEEVDFKNLIFHSSAVLSHYSSTIIYALLFCKPVLSPRWGYSTNLIKNYPENIVKYCASQDEFIEALHGYIPDSSVVDDYLNDIGVDIGINSTKEIVNGIAKKIQK